MQCISIQIQPEFVPTFNRQAFLQQVRSVGRSPEIDEFSEKGKTYLNYNFFTEFPKILWDELQAALYQHPEFSAVIAPISIAACEDEQHPQGYFLLHHFDPSEKVGTFN